MINAAISVKSAADSMSGPCSDQEAARRAARNDGHAWLPRSYILALWDSDGMYWPAGGSLSGEDRACRQADARARTVRNEDTVRQTWADVSFRSVSGAAPSASMLTNSGKQTKAPLCHHTEGRLLRPQCCLIVAHSFSITSRHVAKRTYRSMYAISAGRIGTFASFVQPSRPSISFHWRNRTIASHSARMPL